MKERYLSMIAKARVTRAGLAALRHEQTAGKYPEDLSAVQMGGLIDPFTCKSLIYRGSASGFMACGVGRNLIDDKGSDSGEQDSGDIVWKMPDL